jgi:hypothetical protein
MANVERRYATYRGEPDSEPEPDRPVDAVQGELDRGHLVLTIDGNNLWSLRWTEAHRAQRVDPTQPNSDDRVDAAHRQARLLQERANAQTVSVPRAAATNRVAAATTGSREQHRGLVAAVTRRPP